MHLHFYARHKHKSRRSTVDILFMRHSNSASKLHFALMTISDFASLRVEERVKQFLRLHHQLTMLKYCKRAHFHRLCGTLPCILAYLEASHWVNMAREPNNTAIAICTVAVRDVLCSQSYPSRNF